MDYSLIVGIHDCDRIDPDGPEMNAPNTDSDEPVSGDEENGLEYEENHEIAGFAPTPPDSPQPNVLPAYNGDIDPNIERFGIKSVEGNLYLYQAFCLILFFTTDLVLVIVFC
jgi:hypothetical protein